MQTRVATKLEKALFAPNERFLQPAGNERIYIVKHGRIQIYIDRFGPNRREFRRLLKVISVEDPHSICDNIYGYTAMMSTKACALDAVAADFTSTYFIEKEAFLKCVHSCEVDFEYFHEVRNRIDLSEFCEAYEAPSILNIREHYNPSRTILIRKQRAANAKLSNHRQQYFRNEFRRSKKHYFKGMRRLIDEINDKLINGGSCQHLQNGSRADYLDDSDTSSCQLPNTAFKDAETIFESRQHMRSVSLIRNTQIFKMKSGIALSNQILSPLVKKWLPFVFERAQEYRNFFPRNNLNLIMDHLDNENYKSSVGYSDAAVNLGMYSGNHISFGFKRKSFIDS